MTEESGLAALSDQLAAAVERAGRSTVTVNARRRLPASGIAWDRDIVLTADHVLEREEEIVVVTPDGAEASATVAGRDPGSDIAILRVAGQTLEPAERAPAASARVGHLALAVARPSAEGLMASFGIVSAVGGPWRTFRGTQVSGYLRSDTTFYPGFSGGPLVDSVGRVLGVNSSRLGRGAGLTVPADAAAGIAADLLARGRVRRAYLGISSQRVDLPSALAGALGGQRSALLVVMVEPGSPAEAAGVLVGDLLARGEGTALTDTEALQGVLSPERIDRPLALTVLRGGTPRDLSITPSERP